MIRILTHIILGLILLLSSTGLAVSHHFCGGKHHSTHIGAGEYRCCGDTGPDMLASGCCHNQVEFNLMDDDTVAPTVLSLGQVKLAVLNCFMALPKPEQPFYRFVPRTAFSPPGDPPDLGILFQQFLI